MDKRCTRVVPVKRTKKTDNPNPTYFASRREELGKTQLELAIALEMTPATISQWERGEACPRPQVWDRLADVYRTKAEHIAVECLRIARNMPDTAKA